MLVLVLMSFIYARLLGEDCNPLYSMICGPRCGIVLIGVGWCFNEWKDQLEKSVVTETPMIAGKTQSMDRSAYKRIFYIHFVAYKFFQWQFRRMQVVPGLWYGNLLRTDAHPTLKHAGFFVVGFAVIYMQAILLVVFLAALPTRDWGWVQVIGAAMIPISLKAMEGVFSPSGRMQKLMDTIIEESPCKEIFEKMNNYSLALTDEELVTLQENLDEQGTRFCQVYPGSTFVIKMFYKNVKGWHDMDLSTGRIRRIFE